MKRTFPTAITLGATMAVSNAAYAADTLGGGCVTRFVGYFGYNPNDPKPTVTLVGPATVVVSADGTVAYVNDDVSDVRSLAGCIVVGG